MAKIQRRGRKRGVLYVVAVELFMNYSNMIEMIQHNLYTCFVYGVI